MASFLHGETTDDALELERLRLAQSASLEGIWDWDLQADTLYRSPRVLEFFQDCSDPDTLFTSPFSAIHPDSREEISRVVDHALRPDGPPILAIDARIANDPAEPRWLRIRGTIVRNPAGKVLRIAGSMIDISLRKHAESQVGEERFLLRQLIDHIPVQVYFKDLDSRFVLANQGMAEWMGLKHPRQMIGKHDRDFFEETHWKDAAEDERQIMESGDPVTGKLELETWRKGEPDTWVLTSKFPWKDRHGTLKGTFGISNDVTELVKTRQEALAMAGELQLRNEAYEEELHLAREIQQALAHGGFPRVAARNGTVAEFGSRYIPISGLAGDFFEVIPISAGMAGLLVCDVMGHGVRAALVVAMLRGLLEKQRSHASDPSMFLRGLNDGLSAILERAGTTMFATAFYAVIDLAAGTLRYACAGHPGPVLLGPQGIRQIADNRETKGPALGLIRGVAYPVGILPLSEMERLVMFTDGVLEAENRSGEPFFEKRLMELIDRHRDDPLEALLDTILETVLQFSEAKHFDDDVCLLATELKTTAATAGASPLAELRQSRSSP